MRSTWNSQKNFGRESNVGELTLLPCISTYYKATVFHIVWCQDVRIEQWNRTESLDIDPHIFGQ